MISKEKVRASFIDLLQNKIGAIKTELDAIQESANADTKSSMGDKYETSREMMMQERNRLESQVQVINEQLVALSAIDPEIAYDKITQGSLVQTDGIVFFISAGIGKLDIEGVMVFALSGNAPLAKEMMGREEGDEFSFNGKAFYIKHTA